jgi:hypothetical protein
LDRQECLRTELGDDTRVPTEFDPSQVRWSRLSAVQYMKFTPPEAPVRLGGDFAAMEVSVDLD